MGEAEPGATHQSRCLFPGAEYSLANENRPVKVPLAERAIEGRRLAVSPFSPSSETSGGVFHFVVDVQTTANRGTRKSQNPSTGPKTQIGYRRRR